MKPSYVLGGVLGVATGLMGFVFAQSRNITLDSAAMNVKQVTIVPHTDGSFSIIVCANVPGDGVDVDSCETATVTKGANKTVLGNVVSQARDLWLERQRFIPDGGKL